MTVEDFYAVVAYLRERSALACPVNVLGATAQTFLETGGYTKFRDWNLAGIKCTARWKNKVAPGANGRCWSASTGEYKEGLPVSVVAGFRSYDSLSHFLEDYARLIGSYYPAAAGNSDCVWGFIAGFCNGAAKWATDPGYYGKVARCAVAVAPRLLGVQWRRDLVNSLEVAIARKAISEGQVKQTISILKP